MEPDIAPRRTISLVRYEDDRALLARGSLIPLSVQKSERPLPMVRPGRALMVTTRVIALLLAILAVAELSSVVAPRLAGVAGQGATPAVLFENPYSEWAREPHYGPAAAYSDETFYADTRDALIAGGATFIDLDLVQGDVRLFERGVLTHSGGVLRAPGADSWCQVPAGFYQVREVKPSHYSSYLEATLPSAVVFGGNYFMHSWPLLADGSHVGDEYDRDCVRVSEASASALSRARKDTPVLVHALPEVRETFAFDSKVPNFSTPYYLIADIKSETVLAVGDRHGAVPIASLTKLMTALVAVEALSLDERLSVTEPSLIETVVPRLHDRSRVTLHTLLELLLVESSNEAAEVIANAIGRDEFINRMNERASELGLIDTIFTDPSGLGAGNVSSVTDLWWLTRYIYLHHPYLITLTRDEAPLPDYVSDAFGELINFNTVESVDSFIGGKVGETTAAKQTSVTIHRLVIGGEEHDIAVILLGSEGRRADVIKLLNYIEERFDD